MLFRSGRRDDAYPFEECVDMYRYDLSDGREEAISSPVADYFDRLYVRRPFSLALLLLAYTVLAPSGRIRSSIL